MILEQTLGFAAAGTVAPTSAVKDSLRALLARLWVVPGLGDPSMESFARIVAAVLTPLIAKASSAFGDASATVAVVGHCPSLAKGRAFLLRTDPYRSGMVSVEEVAPSAGPQYFGSGSKSAREVALNDSTLTPPEVIKEVISRGGDSSVGGRVQFGRVDDEHFRVYAVYDVEVNEDAKTFTGGYYLAGVELLEPDVLALPEGFEFLPRFVDPFARRRISLMDSGYDPVVKYSHFQQLFDAAAVRAKLSRPSPHSST